MNKLVAFYGSKGLYDPDTELSPEPNGSSFHPPVLLHSGPLQHYLPPVLIGLSRGCCFSGFLTKILAALLISPMNATCLTHHILRDMIIIIVGDSIDHEAVKYVIISSLSVRPPLTGPNILLSTLFSHYL
jgi:hypothetical protein